MEQIELLRSLIRDIKVLTMPSAFDTKKNNYSFHSKTAKDVFELIEKFEKRTQKNEKDCNNNRKKTR